jgi:hypothetical protein
MNVVRYFDNRWRLAIVYAEGRTKVLLLDLGRLRAIALPKGEAKHFRPVTPTPAPRQLARSIEQQSKCFRDRRRRHAGAVAKRVAAALRKDAACD